MHKLLWIAYFPHRSECNVIYHSLTMALFHLSSLFSLSQNKYHDASLTSLRLWLIHLWICHFIFFQIFVSSRPQLSSWILSQLLLAYGNLVVFVIKASHLKAFFFFSRDSNLLFFCSGLQLRCCNHRGIEAFCLKAQKNTRALKHSRSCTRIKPSRWTLWLYLLTLCDEACN